MTMHQHGWLQTVQRVTGGCIMNNMSILFSFTDLYIVTKCQPDDCGGDGDDDDDDGDGGCGAGDDDDDGVVVAAMKMTMVVVNTPLGHGVGLNTNIITT